VKTWEINRAGYRVTDYWAKASGLKGGDLAIVAFEAVKEFNWISDYEIVKFDLAKPDIMFRVWDLMDCTPFRGKEKKTTSHYFRGIVSGFISKLADKRIVFIETKCIAKGDPYCEFRTERTL